MAKPVPRRSARSQSLYDNPGREGRQDSPNPNLVIDLSDAEAIARTAHAVAVALAEGSRPWW
jgi:hypothetical protein